MIADITEPVIIRNLKVGLTQSLKIINNIDNLDEFILNPFDNGPISQALGDVLKQTVVVAGQGSQFIKTINKDYETHGRLRTMARAFQKEKGYSTPTSHVESKRRPYYRAMKDAFWNASEKDFSKKYWAAYNYVVTDLEQSGVVNPAYKNHIIQSI
jgi:hypothetical protein